MSLSQLTSTYLPAIEAELHRAVGSGPPLLQAYYDMMAYHLGWVDGAGGGKRIRPLLCVLCAAAAGGEWQLALPLAAALELLHNFTLIHDDIQDLSPIRWGRPTVWRRWGKAQAINAGDAMFTVAHLALQDLDLPAEKALSILGEFDRTCLTVTQGQYLDMAFEQRPRVAMTDYLAMIEKKTAALIGASTGLGACVGGAGTHRQAHFQAFGTSLGLAFQIQDDLLGIWGDPAVTGKSTGIDLEARKKTLPVVYGLAHSEEFARAYAQPHTEGISVADLARQLEALGARAYAEQQARAASKQALARLAEAQPVEPAAAALRELTGQLLGRHR